MHRSSETETHSFPRRAALPAGPEYGSWVEKRAKRLLSASKALIGKVVGFGPPGWEA